MPGHARKPDRPDGAAGTGNRTKIGGAMITNLLSPDDVASVMSHPFIAAYWPLILAGPVVFVALAKGYYWVAIPLAGLTVLLQAWRSGVLA
jgi:hypothetical protein